MDANSRTRQSNEPQDGWNDARIALLTSLYQSGSDGWLAGEINRLTGSDFTRNAVIGKRQREKLFRSKDYEGEYRRLDSKNAPQKPRGESRRGKHPKRIYRNDFKSGPAIPADMKTLEQIESAPPPPEFLGLTIWQLTDETCRYPRGVSPPFQYCGQPVKEHSSFCAYCHSLCYLPETPSQLRLREKRGDYLIRRVA